MGNKSTKQNFVSVGGSGKRFISEGEFEDRFGIPKKTLQNMRVLRTGPPFLKINSSVRYDIFEVELWIKSLPRGGSDVSALRTA